MKASLLLMILSLISVTASANRGGSGTVGPGNPAALFCDQLGGEVKIIKNLKWHYYSFCVLGEAHVETWTLYGYLLQKTPQIALMTYQNHPNISQVSGADAASDYCIQVQGSVEVMTDSDENQTKLCKFSDQSLIEIWTLYNGPQSPKNQKLTELISK